MESTSKETKFKLEVKPTGRVSQADSLQGEMLVDSPMQEQIRENKKRMMQLKMFN